MQTALAEKSVIDPLAGYFLASLAAARHETRPYDYWLLENALPDDVIDGIADLPLLPPFAPLFDGRRESNNSTRFYFTPDHCTAYPVCRDVARIFGDMAVVEKIERATKSDLSGGHLRIEYCQDTNGFWLEPHRDISVKLFTMLVYLSDDPDLFDAGTDIYDDTPEHNLVASAPYGKGKGLIFIPGEKTWHGLRKRTIRGLRKSLIVNYVTSEWLSKDELAYQ
ncbi:MAG: 2OG-Fe(II) oxygenase [Bdellovibrionales bacterium]